MPQAMLTKKTPSHITIKVSRRLCAPDTRAPTCCPLHTHLPCLHVFDPCVHVFTRLVTWRRKRATTWQSKSLEPPRTTHLTAINQNRNMKIHNKLMKNTTRLVLKTTHVCFCNLITVAQPRVNFHIDKTNNLSFLEKKLVFNFHIDKKNSLSFF